MQGKAIVFGLIAATLGLTLAQPQAPKVGPEALANLDARQAMNLANAWGVAGIGAKVTSFVTTEAVQFKFENGQTVRVMLPNDRVVIAVAPYLTFTHPCNTHYMSGCRAELADTPFRVLVRTLDGRIVLNDTMRSLGNGFVELWLPRDLALELSLEARGKKATGLISTFAGSDTCITTLKLR